MGNSDRNRTSPTNKFDRALNQIFTIRKTQKLVLLRFDAGRNHHRRFTVFNDVIDHSFERGFVNGAIRSERSQRRNNSRWECQIKVTCNRHHLIHSGFSMADDRLIFSTFLSNQGGEFARRRWHRFSCQGGHQIAKRPGLHRSRKPGV